MLVTKFWITGHSIMLHLTLTLLRSSHGHSLLVFYFMLPLPLEDSFLPSFGTKMPNSGRDVSALSHL